MRAHFVQKAAKETTSTCIKCRETIKVGEAYSWAKAFRSRTKIVKHQRCGSFRQSEIASNDKAAAVYSAIEEMEDFLDAGDFDLDGLNDAVASCADALDEAAEMYRESQETMVDGFGHETSASDEMGERADEVESFAEEVRDALDSIDEAPDEPDVDAASDRLAEMKTEAEEDGGELKCESCGDAPTTVRDDDGNELALCETCAAQVDADATQRWLDDAASAVSDVLGNGPV